MLEPPLWNLCFADVGLPVRTCSFRHTAFADDMNAWLPVDPGTVDPLTLGKTQLQQLQSEVHQYGSANQMSFDPTKETFHFLHSINGFSYGTEQTFRILGCDFDAKLLMHSAVKTISVEAGWRLRSLFRSHRFFSTRKMMLLYKSLVLSYIESFTPAIFDGAASVLERIDRIQDRFLGRVSLAPAGTPQFQPGPADDQT